MIFYFEQDGKNLTKLTIEYYCSCIMLAHLSSERKQTEQLVAGDWLGLCIYFSEVLPSLLRGEVSENQLHLPRVRLYMDRDIYMLSLLL